MKKLLSIVLALALVFTMTVIPTFAEGTTVAYYVGDTQDGEAVAATAGETYKPDRMPTTAAPEGYYFVGWADANGEIVPNGGIVLADGENKLTAVYKPYKPEIEVGLQHHVSSALASNIGFMKNGEYLGQVVGRTGTGTLTSYVEDEESYFQIKPSQYGGGAGYILVDADGDVIQLKNSTKYKVVVEFRIPENNATISMRLQFGAKIYKDGSGTGEAPQFRSSNGSDLDTSTKQVNFYGGATGLTQKWHDNGGYYYRFGDSAENPATTDGWQTTTWTVTTPAYNANFLPVFALDIGMSSWSYTQTFQIKSIKVIDTTLTEVQYIENGEVVANVIGSVANGTYIPDRMPTKAAPAGSYFVGWADENGDIVSTKTGLTLGDGVNKLIAVYKDYQPVIEADLSNHLSTSGEINVPYIKDGVYYSYVNGRNSGAGKTEIVTVDGETYMKVTGQYDGGGGVLFPLADADGDLIQPKLNHSYEITVEFRIPVNEGTASLTSGYGAYTTKAPTFNHQWGVNSDIGGPPKVQYFTATSSISLERKWHDHGGYFYQFGANNNPAVVENWETITFNASSCDVVDGYIPMFHLNVGVSGKATPQEIHIKSITITDATYATVDYVVEGEVVKSVKDVSAGKEFTADYIPAAPEGKFFAGWKDAEGNFVTGKITLAKGTNTLYAYFGDIVDEATNAYFSNGNMIYANFDANGENFKATLPGGNFYIRTANVEHEGNTYVGFKNNQTYNIGLWMNLVDENNVPIVLQPGKSYSIKVKVKNINGGNVNGINFAVGYAPSFRDKIGDSFQNGPKNVAGAYYSSNDHDNKLNTSTNSGGWAQWNYDFSSNGNSSYNVPASEWVTINYNIDLSADYTGFYPIVTTRFAVPAGTTVIFDEIVIAESDVQDDMQTVTFNSAECGAVKLLDNVEDKATYRITLKGNVKTANSWVNAYVMTADADDFYSNRGYTEYATKSVTAFGYTWTQSATKYVTIDKANGQGDALWLVLNNPGNAGIINVIAVEKVEGFENGGAAILADQPEDAKQAIRFYANYETTTGSDIVIGGKKVQIASRGFLIADASKVGEGAVTRSIAANAGSGIVDVNSTDFTKCWEVTDTGTGVETLTFSTYIKGFKAEEGTYNTSQRIYVKAYLVLSDGSVIYSEETVTTVADIAADLGLTN